MNLRVVAAIGAATCLFGACKGPAAVDQTQLSATEPAPLNAATPAVEPPPTKAKAKPRFATTTVELGDIQRIVVLGAEATVLAADVDVLEAPAKGIVGRAAASGGSSDGLWPSVGTRYEDCTALLQVLADQPDGDAALQKRIRAARRCQRDKMIGDTAAVFPLRARCDGRVLEVHRSPGDRVEKGERLVQIGCSGRPVVAVTAAADAKKRLGMITQAWLLTGPIAGDSNERPEARDLGSPIRAGELMWAINADDPQAAPGMAVQVAVAAGAGRPGLTVPSSAVLASEERAFVVVVRNDGALERRAVTPGDTNAVFTELRAGIHAGERVVVRGVVAADASIDNSGE